MQKSCRAEGNAMTFFQSARKKWFPTQNTILAKLSIKNKGNIKTLSDEQKLKEFISTWSALHETLWEILQVERNKKAKNNTITKYGTHW